MLTLGSDITPGVCTCTTFWTNLMHMMRKGAGKLSILEMMFNLTAVMSCHN